MTEIRGQLSLFRRLLGRNAREYEFEERRRRWTQRSCISLQVWVQDPYCRSVTARPTLSLNPGEAVEIKR